MITILGVLGLCAMGFGFGFSVAAGVVLGVKVFRRATAMPTYPAGQSRYELESRN